MGPSTPDRIADRLRLHRQVDRRSRLLVVEGPSDKRFLCAVASVPANCVFPGGSRAQALSALHLAREINVDGIAGVVDRDFDDEVARLASNGLSVLAYPNADLEAMLVYTKAFDRLIEEHATSAKLSAVGGPEGLRDVLTSSLLPLQRLRRLNAMGQLGLAFDSLDVARYIDKDTLDLDLDRLCVAVAASSTSVSAQELAQKGEQIELPSCEITGAPLMRGRDVLIGVSVALRRRLANLGKAAADPKSLERSLRLAGSDARVLPSAWVSAILELAR